MALSSSELTKETVVILATTNSNATSTTGAQATRTCYLRLRSILEYSYVFILQWCARQLLLYCMSWWMALSIKLKKRLESLTASTAKRCEVSSTMTLSKRKNTILTETYTGFSRTHFLREKVTQSKTLFWSTQIAAKCSCGLTTLWLQSLIQCKTSHRSILLQANLGMSHSWEADLGKKITCAIWLKQF